MKTNRLIIGFSNRDDAKVIMKKDITDYFDLEIFSKIIGADLNKDPNMWGCYELNNTSKQKIGEICGINMDKDGIYFLEKEISMDEQEKKSGKVSFALNDLPRMCHSIETEFFLNKRSK